MAKPDTGGDAFPSPGVVLHADTDVSRGAYSGQTLRDWFASQVAVPANTIDNATAMILMGVMKVPSAGQDGLDTIRFFLAAEAKYRYMLADALIAERSFV